MAKALFLTVLAGAALLAGTVGATRAALAQDAALVVEGSVVNGTADGGDVAGLEVMFHQHRPTGQDDFTGQTAADGTFRFEGVGFDPDTQYAVSVEYQGALYGTDLDLSAGSPSPVSLTVYDAVADESVLTSPAVRVLLSGVDEATRTLLVLEITTIANQSDRAYVPDPGQPMAVLRFGLPPGAFDLQVDTALVAAEPVQVSSGFALATTVPPGVHDFLYSYRVPYDGPTVSLPKSFPYGVGTFRMLAPAGEMRLAVEGRESDATVDLGGEPYQVVEASDLPRGSRLTVDVLGLPRQTVVARAERRLESLRPEYTAPALLALLMVAGVAVAVWRRRWPTEQPREPAPETYDSPGDRLALLDMLAQLERGLASGELDAALYAQRRAALMARIATTAPGDWPC